MATFTVTNLFDSGAGSLRQAILDANAVIAPDVINFDLSGGTINLTNDELTISDDLTINGLGSELLTIDGLDASRIFNVSDGDVNSSIDVLIDGLTVTNGRPYDGYSGGIRNRENLTITSSNISGNDTGGILNEGNLTVINSTISGNSVYGIGGGILNGGNLTVINSIISGNSVYSPNGGGGGIFSAGGDLTVTNSTISGNSARSRGEAGGGAFTALLAP